MKILCIRNYASLPLFPALLVIFNVLMYILIYVNVRYVYILYHKDVVRVNVFFFSSSLQVIKVYNEDNTSRAVEVPTDITARDICQLFVMKNHCIDDHSWTLFEHLTHLSIGKI